MDKLDSSIFHLVRFATIGTMLPRRYHLSIDGAKWLVKVPTQRGKLSARQNHKWALHRCCLHQILWTH